MNYDASRKNDSLVWFMAGGIIGPFFFKDDRGRNVTVNGERYRAMIHDFFLPQLAELNLVNMCFIKTAPHATQLVKQ
ncbi:Transposable element Tc3 transposase [Caligus rogercresseyi]|uniref:Transposable element Tc3 transposase n=1 Tax=Caligus rogercresseyi TaxID=217165 RepID=A0A7T8GYR3_CALRO|nr:Transposable element Tc3 transposase [Caligus rogercresseyi]